MVRRGWLVGCWLCLGCHSLVALDSDADRHSAEQWPRQDEEVSSPPPLPRDPAFRMEDAELLLRRGKVSAARGEFVRYLEEAADEPATLRQRIHAHSRLMEIAETEEDAYTEHLHRGIGLYLLARRCAVLEGKAGDISVEGLLFKAADNLASARLLRPDEARPCWYLFVVWRALGQQQPALHWLHETRQAAPFAELTPAERRGLELAGSRLRLGVAR